jgi:hypothetical protein
MSSVAPPSPWQASDGVSVVRELGEVLHGY